MKEKEKPKNNVSIQQSHQKNNPNNKKKSFRGKRPGGNLFVNFSFDLPY